MGSLLLTPLLLLLPTTSVFYIFFTLFSTSLVFICFTIEITISILHATPYAEILLWLARRRRFPSGIWLDIICGANSSSSPNHVLPEIYNMTLKSNERSFNGIQETVVSVLHSKYATLGKLSILIHLYVSFRTVTFKRSFFSYVFDKNKRELIY